MARYVKILILHIEKKQLYLSILMVDKEAAWFLDITLEDGLKKTEGLIFLICFIEMFLTVLYPQSLPYLPYL